MGVNKVILVGNLGKDPEVRKFDNGRSVANFTLATTERYKNRNGEQVENTEWHNISMWTPLAEIAERYLQKGKQVYIEGKITTRQYEDRDGNTRYITEVQARDMQMLSRGDGGGGGGGSSQANDYDSSYGQSAPQSSGPMADGSAGADDDLPF